MSMYRIGDERMTAGQIWDAYVGEQTPAEFMSESRAKGLSSAADAAADYARELPGDLSDADRDSIAGALVDYINQAGLA